MPLIRPASLEDLPALLAMVHDLAHHHSDSPEATEQSLRRDLFTAQPWAIALVAESSHGLIGYAALTRGVQLQSGGRTMDMHHLFVRAESRGTGTGKALVQAALALARAEGCDWLTVSTAPQNARAARFYPALGFKEYQPEGQRFWFDLSANPA